MLFKHHPNKQTVPNPMMHNQTPQVSYIRAPNVQTVRAKVPHSWIPRSTVLHDLYEQAKMTQATMETHKGLITVIKVGFVEQGKLCSPIS